MRILDINYVHIFWLKKSFFLFFFLSWEGMMTLEEVGAHV